MNLWQKIKNFFKHAPSIQEQFEEMMKIEEATFNNISTSVETTTKKVEVEVSAVSDDHTDSVTQIKSVVKKPRKKK